MKLVNVLANKFDISVEEAELEMKDMMNRVFDGEDPEEILYEYGLEPDYVMDLLGC